MTLPARYKIRRGWQTAPLKIHATNNGKTPRVMLHLGPVSIQLDGSRAIRLCDEIIDAVEEARRG